MLSAVTIYNYSGRYYYLLPINSHVTVKALACTLEYTPGEERDGGLFRQYATGRGVFASIYIVLMIGEDAFTMNAVMFIKQLIELI